MFTMSGYNSTSMSGSGGFNLSTKKEDMSVRLKAQNLKRAKVETKQLEVDSKKMEERLKELKLAMNREKEERERKGGGFWKSGQTGTLTTYYTDEVLSKPLKQKSAGSSKGKIKVLKDKPLDLPERTNQPGTMAWIAQKGGNTPRDKPKGPKCGQCEEKAAAVSCLQCTEDYCAGCFAAFHLKGALKKHRSVPLTATPRQCFASPRPNPPYSGRPDNQTAEGAINAYTPNGVRYKKGRNSPEGASGSYDGGGLMVGNFDEDESAASFQEALNAWRSGQSIPNGSTSGSSSAPTPRAVPYSPARTPTVNVDSSTGTVENTKPVEIEFKSSNLSYADRLLLKKHRRTDVDALFTPRSSSVQSTPMATPRNLDAKDGLHLEDMEDFDFDASERVDFHALYEAVTSTQPLSARRESDTVSIVEVKDSKSNQRLEQTSEYQVEEVGFEEAYLVELMNRNAVKPPAGAEKQSSRSKSARKKSARKSARKAKQTLSDEQPFMPNDDMHLKINSMDNDTNRTKEKESTSITNDRVSLDINSSAISSEVRTENVVENKSQRIQSGKSRPQSSKSRPQTGNRPKSRQGGQSRPSSRAKSRAASRAENPGLLTKVPSEALQQIARMTPTSVDGQYTGGLGDFFTSGVEPMEQDRTLTPTKNKSNNDNIKVSYQLYNMAPKSWKPDYSMADSVPIDQVDNESAESDRASSVMAYYNYSEQMVSEMTDRLVSQFGDIESRLEQEVYSREGTPLSSRASRPWSAGPSFQEERFSPRREPTPPSTPKTASRARRPLTSGSPSMSPRTTPPTSARAKKRSTPTPRQSSRRAPLSARAHSRAKTQPETESRPVSRAIVMEGTDLSLYDDVGQTELQDREDEETLDQLEWELASNTGRLTADGKVSRMSGPEDMSQEEVKDFMESFRAFSRMSQQDQGYDINSQLRDDELMADDEDSCDEDDVKALT